jgi:hypothetical protein
MTSLLLTYLLLAILAAAYLHLHVRVSKQETKMGTLENTTERLEAVTTQLGIAVKSEIADLRAAIENGTVTTESLARLETVGDLLTGMVSELDADDIPVFAGGAAPTDPPVDPVPNDPVPNDEA